MPVIRHFAGGSTRSTVARPAVDSTALYMGEFVSHIVGSTAAPDGTEFGAVAFADDSFVYGFATGFSRLATSLPIQDDEMRQGTVTDTTGEYPMKYTFSSTNDESNTTSAKLELVHIMPILPGDILEVSLWGASAVSVDRGTTTAAGTTTSSDNEGVGLAIDTASAPFALLESSADVDLDDCDFVTTTINGRKPRRSHRVFVQMIRGATYYNTVD